MKICSVDGCITKVLSKGYCSKHYQKALKYGNPLADFKLTAKICAVDSCDDKIDTGLYCKKHHQKFLRHGDPLGVADLSGETQKWLERHVEYFCDECLEWPFLKNKFGYGVCAGFVGTKIAHRAMCILAHGKPPTQQHHAAHSCGNTNCVNKNHIRWATKKENEADKKLHGTDNQRERHPLAKLTESQVSEIRSLSFDLSHSEIANRFSISRSHTSSIIAGKYWPKNGDSN